MFGDVKRMRGSGVVVVSWCDGSKVKVKVMVGVW